MTVGTSSGLSEQALGLLSLAKDKSSSARAALARELYDVFLAQGQPTAGDSGAAVDLLLQILGRAAPEVRRSLAARLAGDALAPHALVWALASDEVSIAYPVLVESPVLRDPDLLDLVKNKPIDHKLCIAQREEISEALADAFVETGDCRVMRWIVENPGAQISSTAMILIAELSRDDPDLQRHLMRRPDLPPELAQRLTSLAAEPQPHLTAAPSAAIPEPSKPACPTLDALLTTLRAGKLAEFETLLASYCSIQPDEASAAARGADGQALAALFRAHGIDRNTFVSTFLLLRKLSGAPAASTPTILSRASQAYERAAR
jgi:uncharacterized protein (DUF2336 family)